MSFFEVIGIGTCMVFAVGIYLLVLKTGEWFWLKWRLYRLIKKYQATAWDSPKIKKLAIKISKTHTAIEKF